MVRLKFVRLITVRSNLDRLKIIRSKHAILNIIRLKIVRADQGQTVMIKFKNIGSNKIIRPNHDELKIMTKYGKTKMVGLILVRLKCFKSN